MDFADSGLNVLFMANRKDCGVKHSLNGDAGLKLLYHADADSYFEASLHERTLYTAAELLHQTDPCLSSIFRPTVYRGRKSISVHRRSVSVV